MTEKVLEGCEVFASCYIDNLVVYSNSWEEHLAHLVIIFGRLRSHNLTVKPSKCDIGKTHLENLDHIVGAGWQFQNIGLKASDCFLSQKNRRTSDRSWELCPIIVGSYWALHSSQHFSLQ